MKEIYQKFDFVINKTQYKKYNSFKYKLQSFLMFLSHYTTDSLLNNVIFPKDKL